MSRRIAAVVTESEVSAKAVARFWSHVDKNGPEHPSGEGRGRCWLWTASANSSGFGTLCFEGKSKVAHRVSFEIAHGECSPNASIVASCGNRRCVNPAHLEEVCKGKKWTEDEDQKLQRWFGTPSVPVDIARVAKSMGRTHASVALRVSRLGLGNYSRPKDAQVKIDLGVYKRPGLHFGANKEALAAHVGERVKKWFAEHGHPRGALGMKHTEEAKEKMVMAIKRAWANPSSKFNTPEHRQGLSDRAVARAKAGLALTAAQTYSRAVRGRRDDLGETFFRSSWEANYARFLNWRKERGEIVEWRYECETFWFESIRRGVRSYKPDFKVIFPDGSHEWHEVKGWLDKKSATKLKRMAKYYPQEKVVLVGAEWFKSANTNGLANIIPNWERPKRKKAA